MKPERTTAQVRARLAELIEAFPVSATGASKMLGKPQAYLGRFIREGVPERLEDSEIDRLATFFGVDPYELGALVNLRPPKASTADRAADDREPDHSQP